MLIKISIVVIAFYFIYQKLTNNSGLAFSSFTKIITENSIFSAKSIIILSFLSIFNWFFEILKWQKLVSAIKNIAFKNALEQTLGSLTASLFTPNRIGEYGAKAIYYTKTFRKKIMLTNLISNALQMAVTTFLGAIGCYFFVSKYQMALNTSKFFIISIFALFIITLIVFIIRKTKFRFKGFSFEKIKAFVLYYPKSTIAFGIGYSLLRYAIFSFQFYYLLTLFNINISYFDAMLFITTMYLLASIIPSIFIFDVVVKSGIAVYLFSFVGINALTILSIVTIMWLFNFVIPSIFGSYFVLKFNFPETNP
ncbi:lysylphosphatidylglycerol synthase domain-containing protein [Mariniflexile jejuense]|uniref:Lysylphosphatidylglycerol synthase domain-containing protein n=1 Tax=Mariniflexile jejuense TaxID=1173582 RepID=A0ABW3JIC8_9FLAO